MKYIKFKIPKSNSQSKKDNLLEKYFFNPIKFILMKVSPANPDFENQIDNVEYWLLECAVESGIPEREIGIDKNGNVIIKMPFKDNYGFWTDNNLTLNDFLKRFEASEINEEEFETNWKNLQHTWKNMNDKNRFEFVYVEINGKVRELDNEEIEYLSETFHPNDGGRPYIKQNFTDLTPDGKISGFICRSRIPKNITIDEKKANA